MYQCISTRTITCFIFFVIIFGFSVCKNVTGIAKRGLPHALCNLRTLMIHIFRLKNSTLEIWLVVSTIQYNLVFLLASTSTSSARGGGKGYWIPREKKSEHQHGLMDEEYCRFICYLNTKLWSHS